MASRIKLKRSLTPNSVPTTSDLTDKEVGLNIADRTLFVNNGGTITEVLNADPNDETIVPSMFSSAITNGVGNTWYVSGNGVDKTTLGSVNPRHGATTGANVWGKTPTTAFASLKYALDNYAQSGDTVIISSGTYIETFPLTVPVGVVIKGTGVKSTFIKPTVITNDEDAFLIEGNCNIEDLCVCDFYYDSVGDTGYGFRLKSTYSVSADGRRPYIQRCSVITKGSATSGSDPRGYGAGDAGRGALVDGSIVDASSSEAALLFNECTFVVPNAVGLYLKNGARAEWLNSFTYFAADSIKGENPGGTGFKGAGKTRLKLNGVSGTFNSSDTITYYDQDGVTVLGSGTIDSNDGTYIFIDGQGTGQFLEAETDTSGKAVTANGDAQLDTAVQKFGTASLLLDGTGDSLALAGSSDFGFGTGDFTVEGFVRRSNSGNSTHVIADFRSTSGTVATVLKIDGGVVEFVSANGAGTITGTTSLNSNIFYHVAVVRESGVTKLYIDGTQEGSNLADTTDYGTSKALVIGADYTGANEVSGHLDEIRVSKGLARYTGAFTPTTSEFVKDTNTQLLLQFNGIDGSTNILDGSVSSQDIRSSSGGTAQYIALADYTDFGAELRSIGSASVYGERGVTASGKGVRLRCIIHNFGYIGTNDDSTNDISNVNQANEIIESAGGRALFTSMDQNGDFRVGNAFFVDQENGTVSFVGGSQSGGTTFDQLVVTGTGDTTTILPTSISLGSLKLSGNTLESLSGDLELSAPSGSKVDVNNQLRVSDGTLPLPGLAFINDQDTGLQRSGSGEINFVANGTPIVQTTPTNFNVFADILSQQVQVDTLQIDSSGSGFNAGTFTNVPTTTSQNGQGLLLNVVVTAFDATITNPGSGYSVGNFSNVGITGGSGTGATADVVVQGIENGNTVGGSGYENYAYGNVPLQGGNGSGAIVNMIATGGNLAINSIVSHGTNYQNGDVLTVNNSDLTYIDPATDQTTASGGSSFSYTLAQVPYTVTSVSAPTGQYLGDGYIAGETVGLDNSTMGGSGSNAAFTLDNVQYISSATVVNGGTDYIQGDNISIADPSIGSNGNIVGIGVEVTISIAVRPATTTGNAFWFDLSDGNGYVEKPSLQLKRDTLYRFVYEEDGTEYDDHPISFSTTSDGTWSGGDSDVDFIGAVGDDDTRLLLVPSSGPTTIYYFCTQHPGMGGSATVSGTPGSGEALSVLTTALNNTINIGVDGSTSFQAMNVANNTTVGSLNVNGTTTLSGALNLLGSSISATSITLVDNAIVGGTLSVTGETNEVSTFANDVAFDTNLLVVDAQEDRVGIKVAEPVYEFEVDASAKLHQNVVLSTTSGTGVTVGDDPGVDGTTELALNPTNKFNVLGDSNFNGVVKFANGTTVAPSMAFSNSLSTGFFSTTPGTISVTSTSGTVADIKSDEINFFRGLKFTTNTVDQFTVISGSNYAENVYSNIALTGGSGVGLTVDFSVAFVPNITNAGADYDEAVYDNVPLTNVSSVPAGAVQTTSILSGGQDYPNGTFNNVTLTGGNGSVAEATVTVTDNVVSDVVISISGSGYQVSDSLSLSGSSLGGSIIASLDASITGGSGYTNGSYTNIPTTTNNSGSGATLDITVELGAVTSATINEPGVGYGTSDTLEISGTDITDDVISGLSVSNAGQYYANGTYNGVSLTGGTGAGATANITVSGNSITNATIANGGLAYTQGDVLTASVTDLGGSEGAGIVYTTTVADPGSSYTDGSYSAVALTGGNGSSATADIDVSGGVVTNVVLVSGGSGYQTSDVLSVAASDVGGTGSGVQISITIQQATGGEFTVAGVVVGSGFQATIATVALGSSASINVDAVSDGNGGSGATARITVDPSFAVTEMVILSNGSGYSIGDVVTANNADMQYIDSNGDPATTATPSTQFQATISSLGGIQALTINSSGEGYAVNDVLTISNTLVGNVGFNFTFTIDNISSEDTVSIDDDLGQINTKSITNLIDGINLDNKIQITPSGITRTDNNNLLLTTQTGSFVQITGTDALYLPSGTTTERPTGVPGLIRFNTEEVLFEGYDGNAWASLGGVRDVDFDTFIKTETSAGSDEDTFFFFNENVNTLKLDQNEFTLNGVQNFKSTNLNGVNLWISNTAVKDSSEVSTFTPSTAVNYTDDTITLTDHNLITGSIVTYSPGVGETPVNPLVDATTYYVFVVDTNTIKLAESEINLNANTYINLQSSPSHTGSAHTFTPLNPAANLVHSGENVYAVTTSGTFGSTAPTHASGAVLNGTVELTFIRSIYSDLTAILNNYFFTVDKLDINSGSLIFKGDSTSAFIESQSDSLIFAINSSKELLKISETGGFSVNTNFSGTTPSYVEVINSDLKKLELIDYGVVTNTGTLTVTGGNALNVSTHPVSASKSGKIQIELEDSISTNEYSVVVLGSNEYALSGLTSPALNNIVVGRTYIFNQLDSTNNGNPLFFSETTEGPTEYTTNVVYRLDGSVVTRSEYLTGFDAATTEREIQITIAPDAPVSLNYYNLSATGYGNTITTIERRRQYTEISYLINSRETDVYYTEINKIYTDVILADVSADIDGSNFAINITDVTNAPGEYDVKVVAHNILT
jgi:hypothetical protein